jgi:hypothetical protein
VRQSALTPEKERRSFQSLSYDSFANRLLCGSSLPPKHQSNHILRTKAKYYGGTVAINSQKVGAE